MTVQYKGFGKPWDWRKRNADIALNSFPAVEDRDGRWREQAAGELTTVDLRSFDIPGGADNLRLSLGKPTGEVPIRVVGGAHRIRIDRPAGVPVRLRSPALRRASSSTGSAWGARPAERSSSSTGVDGASDLFEIEIDRRRREGPGRRGGLTLPRQARGASRARWAKNSARVRSRVRNSPSTADVVMIVPGLADAAHDGAQVGRLDDHADALRLRAGPGGTRRSAG